MKYAILLYDNPQNWQDVGDDELQSLHAGYMAVSAAPESYGGAQLQPAEQAKTLRLRGGELLVTDGPFAETKEAVGGFDIIECGSLDEAVEIAAGHPVAQLGTIEVRPLWGN